MRSPDEVVFFFFESFSVRCGCSHWTPAPQPRVRHKDAGQRRDGRPPSREPARVGTERDFLRHGPQSLFAGV